MCPKCYPSSFSGSRIDGNHISPRFGNCRRWEYVVDGKQYSNIFEAYAGEQGWVWFYLEGQACPCGSGYPTFEFLGGKIELMHKAHPMTIEFDDGTSTNVVCPEMHLGPYERWKEPHAIEQARQKISEQLEDALRQLGDFRSMLEEAQARSNPPDEEADA